MSKKTGGALVTGAIRPATANRNQFPTLTVVTGETLDLRAGGVLPMIGSMVGVPSRATGRPHGCHRRERLTVPGPLGSCSVTAASGRTAGGVVASGAAG